MVPPPPDLIFDNLVFLSKFAKVQTFEVIFKLNQYPEFPNLFLKLLHLLIIFRA